jgi:hypothetical protein
MKRDNSLTSRRAGLSLVVAALLAMGALSPPQALAQLPARFYWKPLSGVNAVPLIYESISGNTNPFDPAHTVMAGGSIDATMTLAGYVHAFTLFDRPDFRRGHRGRQHVPAIDQRVRRPDARVRHQSDRSQGAE